MKYFLLGIGIEGVNNKLKVNHLSIHKKGHNCLSTFFKGFVALEEDHKLQNSAGLRGNISVQEGGRPR
jgi:hypothetical protein